MALPVTVTGARVVTGGVPAAGCAAGAGGEDVGGGRLRPGAGGEHRASAARPVKARRMARGRGDDTGRPAEGAAAGLRPARDPGRDMGSWGM